MLAAPEALASGVGTMGRSDMRVGEAVAEMAAASETGSGPAGISAAELARAQVAYRGSLESSRAWRGFTTNTKHHDMTYWSLLCLLFVEPGMNRTMLVDKIIEYAGVSRSTAERAIREARMNGYIVDHPAGKEVLYYLSEATFDHCIHFFRNYLDMEKVLKNLGHDRG